MTSTHIYIILQIKKQRNITQKWRALKMNIDFSLYYRCHYCELGCVLIVVGCGVLPYCNVLRNCGLWSRVRWADVVDGGHARRRSVCRGCVQEGASRWPEERRVPPTTCVYTPAQIYRWLAFSYNCCFVSCLTMLFWRLDNRFWLS